jgi:hypothetical protein
MNVSAELVSPEVSSSEFVVPDCLMVDVRPSRQSPTPGDGLVFETLAWRRSSPALARLPPEHRSWSIGVRCTIPQNSTHGLQPLAQGYLPGRRR